MEIEKGGVISSQSHRQLHDTDGFGIACAWYMVPLQFIECMK